MKSPKIPNDTRNPIAKQWILDNSAQYTTREDAFRAYNSEIGEVSRSQFSQLWRYHARPSNALPPNPKTRTIGKRLSIEAKIMRTIEALHRIQTEYVRQQAKLRRVFA